MELNTISKLELQVFEKFFNGDLKNSDGKIYAKRIMISIRHRLHWHFLQKRKLDIVNDPDLKEVNKNFKKAGIGAVVHVHKDTVKTI